MWIVRLALRRTYPFVVVTLLIAALDWVSIYCMSTDISPNIDIPVVRVVGQYAGMPAGEIERRFRLARAVREKEAHPWFGKRSRTAASCSWPGRRSSRPPA
jgi:hypothetical protein